MCGNLVESEIKEALPDQGIIILHYEASGISDFILISMRTEKQMEMVYAVLDQL